MLDAQAVVAAAQQDVPPAGWQVWREQRGFFLRLAVSGIVFIVLSGLGALYLQSHPLAAYTLGGFGDTSNIEIGSGLFNAARVEDFVVLGLFALLGLCIIIWGIYRATAGGDQLLVLTPEGLVDSRKGKSRAYQFATVRSLTLVRIYGTLQVRLITTDGTKATLKVDGRFGAPQTIARAILAAYRQIYPDTQPNRVIDKLRRRGK